MTIEQDMLIISDYVDNSYGDEQSCGEAIEAIARLRETIRNEREECAKLCEAQANDHGGQDWYISGALDCAKAIRERSVAL